jgi:Cd2+/Zn2+-exporting ATPase
MSEPHPSHEPGCCSDESVQDRMPGGPARTFVVHGMDCADEVATLRRALAALVPAESLRFDVLNGKMSVNAPVSVDAVIQAVAATGMRAEPWLESASGSAPSSSRSRRDLLTATSGVALAVGFGLHVALGGLTAAIGSEGTGLAEAAPW